MAACCTAEKLTSYSHLNPYNSDALSTFNYPIVCTVSTKAQADNVDSLNNGFHMVAAASLTKERVSAFKNHVLKHNPSFGVTST